MMENLSVFHLYIDKGVVVYSVKEGYSIGITGSARSWGCPSAWRWRSRDLISSRTKESLA